MQCRVELMENDGSAFRLGPCWFAQLRTLYTGKGYFVGENVERLGDFNK